MEANAFKKRIELAFNRKEFLKIIFQYPSRDRAVVKRGVVVSISDKGFEFEEIQDGLVAYSYNYIVEIRAEHELNYSGEVK